MNLIHGRCYVRSDGKITGPLKAYQHTLGETIYFLDEKHNKLYSQDNVLLESMGDLDDMLVDQHTEYPMLFLEEGKRYIDEAGRITGPLIKLLVGTNPFLDTTTTCEYTKEGRYYSTIRSQYDLLAEYVTVRPPIITEEAKEYAFTLMEIICSCKTDMERLEKNMEENSEALDNLMLYCNSKIQDLKEELNKNY